MYILPREQDKLLLHQAGLLAQKRLARGLQLNINEATALIASQLQERIRDGHHSVAELMQHGKTLLGRRHVLPSVPARLHDIQVEGTFHDGVFLVTVHDPICMDDAFPPPQSLSESLPGAIVAKKERIVINRGRERIRLKVTNNGDRPIQVGSHYHFVETNKALAFDRVKAFHKRLDIPAGTAVRFEPGDTKTVTLCSIAGEKCPKGGNNITALIARHLASGDAEPVVDTKRLSGFTHVPEPDAPLVHSDSDMGREEYISMFGPTVGDRVRLGDTSLWIRIERDSAVYGDEVKFGGGDLAAVEALDLVITNAVIIDWSGIYKADIGVRGGIIVRIGKAGNPDMMHGVTDSRLVIGSATEVIAGEKLIVTAGAIDAHVHYICPQQVTEALASGTTTMIGGGTGPSAGTNATTCTSSPFYIQHMLAATDGLPMNFAFTGKGNDSSIAAMEEVVKAGAAGLKLHEDWGSTPAAIKACLDVGDLYDVQVNIHTDTLNESGFVESTIEAFGGRTIHTYHTEGAGGGHAPDIIVVCGLNNVLPSSTNPTRPYATNTLDEHLDMLMVCHHLDKSIPEDLAFAESRIRAETVAAEDVLHDMGAISMISSDSQAMGRVGEVVARTWRTASKLRSLRGPLTELGDTNECDNWRVKRYIAKYTINPCVYLPLPTVSTSYVGSIEVGKVADLVLWKPENFGAKPEMILKSGVIAWAQMGDANASIPTVQPTYGRPMWGSLPGSAARNSYAFVSKHSVDYGRFAAVKNCRSVKKKDMKLNDAMPKMSVDPESYEVRADGVLADVEPAKTVALAREYNFF
ncbi:hypothetical protein F5141DRAFT_1121071 [Pisolithus sp. B1]|nr:hypothetical protein F5141DRAFT_1121071 [Pisolithus sp. B1]